MKLMIEVPDSFYSDLKENRIDLGAIGCQLLLDKVKNGTPLEECEDAIKYFNIINELSETLGVPYDFIDEKIKEIIPALKKPSISEDGTLTVNVEDGNKVSRVLVCGDNHFGGLYYPEQEPCKDTISREAVIDIIEDVCPIYGNDYRYILRDEVNELPPVKPTEKVGHWISNAEDDLKISEYTCSNCKGLSDEDLDFCPKCGSYNGGTQHDD